MQVEKVGRLEILVASLRSRNDTLATRSMVLLQIEVDGPKTSRAENQRFSLQRDKSGRGQACIWSSEQSENERKSEIQCKKDNSERGDCTRWITRGQCSLGDSCALTHEPKKKGKGKGRFRSLSPTGSPHRTSKGDGKGSGDGGLKGTKNLLLKVRQGKRTDYLV